MQYRITWFSSQCTLLFIHICSLSLMQSNTYITLRNTHNFHTQYTTQLHHSNTQYTPSYTIYIVHNTLIHEHKILALTHTHTHTHMQHYSHIHNTHYTTLPHTITKHCCPHNTLLTLISRVEHTINTYTPATTKHNAT